LTSDFAWKSTLISRQKKGMYQDTIILIYFYD